MPRMSEEARKLYNAYMLAYYHANKEKIAKQRKERKQNARKEKQTLEQL